MLKETSIPSTKLRQNTLLFQGVALFFVLIIMILCYFKCMIFTSYATPFARVPEYNESILLFPFFLLLVWQGATFLVKNRVYHFQLHSDVLIITSRTAFSKKRDFFHIEQINSVLIEKEQKYKAGSSSIFDYAITVLSIKSINKDLIRYTFSPSYHELKSLKELLKDFI